MKWIEKSKDTYFHKAGNADLLVALQKSGQELVENPALNMTDLVTENLNIMH